MHLLQFPCWIRGTETTSMTKIVVSTIATRSAYKAMETLMKVCMKEEILLMALLRRRNKILLLF